LLKSQGIFGEDLVAQDMQVQVKDSLTGAGTIVDDQPEGIANTGPLRQFPGFEQQVSQQGLVCVRGIHKPANGLFGDQQQVRGRFWCDVPNGKTEVILVQNLSRDFTVEYSGKDGFFSHGKFRPDFFLFAMYLFIYPVSYSFALFPVPVLTSQSVG